MARSLRAAGARKASLKRTTQAGKVIAGRAGCSLHSEVDMAIGVHVSDSDCRDDHAEPEGLDGVASSEGFQSEVIVEPSRTEEATSCLTSSDGGSEYRLVAPVHG